MKKLDFISEVGKLKDIERTGWVIHSVKNPESVSDHCFRIAIMALLYAKDENLDVNKCIKLGLIHELHEIYSGDIATRPREELQMVSNKEKAELQRLGFKKLMKLLPNPEIESLWQEYDQQKSPESIFVNDLDKIEMVLQALEYKKYKRASKDLDEFFVSSGPRIKTKKGKEIWDKIKNDYSRLK